MTDKQEKQEEKPAYEDFVTSLPDPIKLITEKETALMREHSEIMLALGKKNMTAKDIHDLYRDRKTGGYTKTIKTIYRYINALEEAGLVKIAGHRKPIDSRMTERLYCRTATIFFSEDIAQRPRWWLTEEGKEIMKKIGRLVQVMFGLSEENTPTFLQLMEEYYEIWTEMTNELMIKIGKDPELATVLAGQNIEQLKSTMGVIGDLGAFLKVPKFLERLEKLVNL